MNVDYSTEVINVFSSPQHVYSPEYTSNLMGYAGDTNIGEYVHLYFQVQKAQEYSKTIILSARFSAIGSVMTIAAAEKFCSLVEGETIKDAMNCFHDPFFLSTLEKMHSVNFVTLAFYKAVETLTTS